MSYKLVWLFRRGFPVTQKSKRFRLSLSGSYTLTESKYFRFLCFREFSTKKSSTPYGGCTYFSRQCTYLVFYILIINEKIQSRLVYCKKREAPTTATIGKAGFQSKQWIGCRPTHSVAYTAKVGVRGTLVPCKKRVLTVLILCGKWIAEFFCIWTLSLNQ